MYLLRISNLTILERLIKEYLGVSDSSLYVSSIEASDVSAIEVSDTLSNRTILGYQCTSFDILWSLHVNPIGLHKCIYMIRSTTKIEISNSYGHAIFQFCYDLSKRLFVCFFIEPCAHPHRQQTLKHCSMEGVVLSHLHLDIS